MESRENVSSCGAWITAPTLGQPLTWSLHPVNTRMLEEMGLGMEIKVA